MFLLAACTTSNSDTGAESDIVLPDVSAATFVEGIDNPYLPMPVGATWTLVAETEDGTEEIFVEVLNETREIEGVVATVVRDTNTLDGALVEDTYDWYAQDSEGNVWYLGEDTCEYENDVCVDTHGSWEWGVDGALPGILMPGDPAVDGQRYFQEYYEGEAEDVGEVVAVGVSIEVAAGSFDDCVRTHDTTPLDAAMDEYKTYCNGVGIVFVEEPDAEEELTEYSGL